MNSVDFQNATRKATQFWQSGATHQALDCLKPCLDADYLQALLLASKIHTTINNRPAARELLQASILHKHHPDITQALFYLDECFFTPIQGRRVVLARRGPDDQAFVKQCWNNRSFMMRFHRFARAIHNDDVLNQVLLAENNATLLTSTALHWTIKAHAGQPIGFISLVDYSAENKRAELVVGLPAPRFGVALEACLLFLDFVFGELKLNKLCSVIYDQNTLAIQSTTHLGFVLEGVQRQHVYDPVDRRFLDLIHSSLLANEYYANDSLHKLRRKLLPPFSGN